jgi:hypothetical protein
MTELTEKLYKVRMDNGDVALVQPLSPLAYQSLLREAERIYPDPDKAQYTQPLPNALDPSLTIAAEDNPEYVQAIKKAVQKQMDWVYVAMLRAGVIVDTEEGKQATFNRYRPKLAQLAALGGEIEDVVRTNPWLATCLFCIVTTRTDIRNVGDAARENLSQEEIRAAIKAFFRPVQRSGLAGDHRAEVTPGVSGSTREAAQTNNRTQPAIG